MIYGHGPFLFKSFLSSFKLFLQINWCRLICWCYPLITAGLHLQKKLHRLSELLKPIHLYKGMFSVEPATKLFKFFNFFFRIQPQSPANV